MIKTLYPSKPDPHVLSLVLSRAKGGALSPRLAKALQPIRTFAPLLRRRVLSVAEKVQRPERSQVAHSSPILA
jgi:hypothetical protein